MIASPTEENKKKFDENIKNFIDENIKNYIAPYKEGTQYADLPKEQIFNLLKEWLDAKSRAGKEYFNRSRISQCSKLRKNCAQR